MIRDVVVNQRAVRQTEEISQAARELVSHSRFDSGQVNPRKSLPSQHPHSACREQRQSASVRVRVLAVYLPPDKRAITVRSSTHLTTPTGLCIITRLSTAISS